MSKFREDFQRSYTEAKEAAHHKKRGARFYISIVTFILIAIVIWNTRSEMAQAFQLMTKANIWVLLLIIPVQFFSYLASAEIFLTYLRGRGQLKDVSTVGSTSMALEFNFVNHVFPTAGVSGASYMIWRLGKLGVPAGQAMMSQIINWISLGSTFIIMMIISLIIATAENKAANWLIMATTIAAVALVLVLIFGSFLIGSRERLMSFGKWLARHINNFGHKVLKRKKPPMRMQAVEDFVNDFFDDFQAIKQDKALLKGPIVWGFISNLLDVMLIAIAFWSLGYPIDLALLLIGFGAASVGAFAMATPGGVGAYEAVMIGVLVAGGAPTEMASAGTILSRVILIIGTIVVGAVAYHRTMTKYGQPDYQAASMADKKRDDEREKMKQSSIKKTSSASSGKKSEATK